MKILVVAHTSRITGGANRSLIDIIERLKNTYFVDVEVVIPNKDGALYNKLKELNIKTYYTKGKFGSAIEYKKNLISYLYKFAIAWAADKHDIANGIKIARKVRRKNFDLVYTNTRCTKVGSVIARILKVPHVCHVREFATNNKIRCFWDNKKIYKHSEKVICISNAIKEEFNKPQDDKKLITIHNGISSPLYKKRKSKKTNFDILLTARIIEDKGHIDALKALNILVKKHNNIVLHLAGSVPNYCTNDYLNYLKKYIKDHGLQNNVIFHGEVDNMLDLRKNIDLELMCAIKEPFGRITIEAMRCSIPVIGANTGGTLEIIKNKQNGLFYEQGNAKDLAKKIENLYKDREYLYKLGKQAYEYSKNNFLVDDNCKKVYEVLKNIKK